MAESHPRLLSRRFSRATRTRDRFSETSSWLVRHGVGAWHSVSLWHSYKRASGLTYSSPINREYTSSSSVPGPNLSGNPLVTPVSQLSAGDLLSIYICQAVGRFHDCHEKTLTMISAETQTDDTASPLAVKFSIKQQRTPTNTAYTLLTNNPEICTTMDTWASPHREVISNLFLFEEVDLGFSLFTILQKWHVSAVIDDFKFEQISPNESRQDLTGFILTDMRWSGYR